jgi:hypothetical protein
VGQNLWVIEFGMIAFVLVMPRALIFGAWWIARSRLLVLSRSGYAESGF